MLDVRLRVWKDKICDPFVVSVSRVLSATQLTLLGLVFGLVCVGFASSGRYPEAQAFWWLNRFVDGLDGAVARHTKTQTDFGGFLDITCDFFIYGLLPISIVYQQSTLMVLSRVDWLVLAFLESTYFVNNGVLFYLAAILEKRAVGAKARGELTSITMPVGLIEGSETVLTYSLFLFFPQHSTLLFALFALAVVFTTLQRILWASNVLNEETTATATTKRHKTN